MKASYFFLTATALLTHALSVKADGLKINLGNDNFTASTELLFTPTSTPGFEKGLDREYHKLPGNHVNYIYSVAEARHKLYVNYLQKPCAYTAIALQVVVQEEGTFSFYIEDRANNLSDLQFSLTDAGTGKTVSITPEEITEMTFSASDVHKKKNFVLHIFPSLKIASSPVSCSGSSNGAISVLFNPGSDWEATLKNASTSVIQTAKSTKDKISFDNLPAGVYYVEIRKNDMVIAEEITAVSKPTGLQSKFTLSTDTIYPGKKFSTDNLSYGGDHWYWEFGDNTSSIGYDVAHAYTIPGDYTVTLTISNISGCTSKTSKQIHVEALTANPLVNDNVRKL